MGQYQQPYLNLKGMDLELAQRNSQVTIPFMVSSRGYGFLWNNPAIGRAVLGCNIISFEAYATKKLDCWVVAGDAPAEIEEAYAAVTGKVPMMPEYGLGYWQCKLRYTNIRLPFLPPSREALGEHGRIGMVIPAELFQVDCAAKARSCLGSRFDRLTIKAGIGCSPAGNCFHSRSFSGSRNRGNRAASFGKQKGRAAAQYKGIAGNDCSE